MNKNILITPVVLLLAFIMALAGCTSFPKLYFDTQGNIKESWVDINKKLDQGNRVKVDDKGNVFVWASGNIITKYNSNGKKLWQNNYHFGYPWDVALVRGYIYVAGNSNIIKLDLNGNVQWSVPFSDGASTKSDPMAITVDSDNNVFVAGRLTYEGVNKCAIIKYSPNGEFLWAGTFTNGRSTENSPIVLHDMWVSVAIDNSGNVVTAGYAGTVKYSRDGKQLWVGTRGGRDIAVDDLRNIYVTGWDGTTKYDENGNVLWKNTEDSSVIRIDNSGYIYISYPTTNPFPGSPPGKTIKYDSDGHTIWSQDNGGGCMFIDQSDGIYFINEQTTIVKFDGDGNIQWMARLVHNGGTNDGELYDLAVDKSGSVFTTGLITGSQLFSDFPVDAYVTVKFSQK